MENVSSNYSNLLGPRVAQNAVPQSNVPVANSRIPTNDSMQLSAAPADMAIAVPTVTPTSGMRDELLSMRGELMAINKQLEGMIAKLAEQPAAAPRPAAGPAATDDDEPVGNVGDDDVVAGPTQASAPARQTQYTVKPGDYLWKISLDQLGDAKRWTEIYQLNHEAIGQNPNLLQPGLQLTLPGVPAIQPPRAPVAPPPPAATIPAVPTTNLPALPAPPPAMPNQVPTRPTTVPTAPAYNTPAPAPLGAVDVPPVPPTKRNFSEAQIAAFGVQYGLVPQGQTQLTAAQRANVLSFFDELDSYEGANRGKVFGPGIEAVAKTPEEAQRIRGSVSEIQQALTLLIKAGRLQVKGSDGRPITDLALTGSFFKMDAQGRELRNAQGAPLMDEAFVSAITEFKQQHGIHQNYRLADGTFGINEFVGPATVEALKAELIAVQSQPRT